MTQNTIRGREAASRVFSAFQTRADRWERASSGSCSRAGAGANARRPAARRRAATRRARTARGVLRVPRNAIHRAGARAPGGGRLDGPRAAHPADQRRAACQRLPPRPEAWRADGRLENRGARRFCRRCSVDADQQRRPYFEVLIVSPREPATWGETAGRLPTVASGLDPFVYEPILVGGLEEAVLAVLANPSSSQS